LRPAIVAIFLSVALAACVRSPAPSAPSVVPGCDARSLTGSGSYDPRQFHGDVVWVDFWASWCGSCAESFPFLEDLQRQLGGRGLRVLAISVDERVRDARAFLARHPVGFALAADPGGKCAGRFGVRALPAAFLVDRQGNVRHVQAGFRADQAPALRGRVEALLAETAEPAR
jgi:thiol-disulfide isomerase/thioredoxin